MLKIIFLLFYVNYVCCDKIEDLDIPSSHLPYYFNTYKNVLAEYCKENPEFDLCVSWYINKYSSGSDVYISCVLHYLAEKGLQSVLGIWIGLWFIPFLSPTDMPRYSQWLGANEKRAN